MQGKTAAVNRIAGQSHRRGVINDRRWTLQPERQLTEEVAAIKNAGSSIALDAIN